MGRSVPEWIGATPDTPVPTRVKLRVFERFGGRCYLTNVKIRAGDVWQIEHVEALCNGGENRESNLAPVLTGPHKLKSRRDVAIKSKTARTKAKHFGLRSKSRLTHPTLVRGVDGRVLQRAS